MTENFPADVLRSELHEVDDSSELNKEELAWAEESWQRLLALAVEADFVDDAVARDSDFVLLRWPRQPDKARLDMMAAALRGLAIRRGTAMSRAEVRRHLAELRADVADELATSPDAFGERAVADRQLHELDEFLSVLDAGPAPVERFSEADFAFWIAEFQLPEELLFAAVHPEPAEELEAQGTGGFSVVRANVHAWDSFRKRVREQIRAGSAAGSDTAAED